MLNNKNFLAIIPARGGSKGVINKNLRLLGGKSLLQRTAEQAKASKYIDRIILSSDSQNIINEAIRCGIDVPFIRPEELAQDDTPGIDPILHAIENVTGYDYIVVLQVTSPFRSTEDIDGCIEVCLSSSAPSAASVVEVSESPYWMYSMRGQTLMPLIARDKLVARRQDLPKAFILNGAVYVVSITCLKEKKTLIAEDSVGYCMPSNRSIDIDTEEDLKWSEFYLTMNK